MTPQKFITLENSRIVKHLILITIAINISVIALATVALHKSKHQSIEQAMVTTQNISRLLEPGLKDVIGKIDVGLGDIAGHVQTQLAGGGFNNLKINEYLQQEQNHLPEMNDLQIVDSNGTAIYRIGGMAGNQSSVADSPFFTRLRDEPDTMVFFSDPFKGDISGKWEMRIARRINYPGNSFAGVASASVYLDTIYNLFSATDVDQNGVIALRDDKLRFVVRYPEQHAPASNKGVSREFRYLVSSGKNTGTYTAKAVSDNIERTYSYRKISGYPFYISVGVASNDYLAYWRKDVAQTATLVLLFCLAITFSIWRIYCEWKRRNAAVIDLIQQKAKYQTVADHTYAWEFWLCPNGTFIYSSPSCKGVTGYDAAAFYSDPGLLQKLIIPEDQEKYCGHRRKAETGVPSENEFIRIQHADGTVRLLAHECLPVYDQSGMFLGTRGSHRDVTRSKQIEKELKESEEHFQQLFIQNWDAVMLIHQNTFDVVNANPAMLSLFGYSLEELQQLGFRPLIAPDAMLQFSQFLLEAILKGESFMEKGNSVCKDGTCLAISAKAKLIRLKEENVLYCSIRDISDRVRLEKEKFEVQSKLIHANKMTSLGMLVSGIAHEINNPNQYISTNASILREVWNDVCKILVIYKEEHGDFSLKGIPFAQAQETVPRLLTGVSEGSHRIETILKNLKDYSREHSGQLSSTFDINTTVQTAVQILTHHIHKHTYNFNLYLGADIPLVKGKAQQIEQVVINLITNALQALSNKTEAIHITTSYEQESNLIVLSVCDQGKGMTKEVMGLVTEPFFTTRLEEGGTGLGLSISSTILKEHEGTLEFQSEPASGTTVTIKLQAAHECNKQC